MSTCICRSIFNEKNASNCFDNNEKNLQNKVSQQNHKEHNNNYHKNQPSSAITAHHWPINVQRFVLISWLLACTWCIRGFFQNAVCSTYSARKTNRTMITYWISVWLASSMPSRNVSIYWVYGLHGVSIRDPVYPTYSVQDILLATWELVVSQTLAMKYLTSNRFFTDLCHTVFHR